MRNSRTCFLAAEVWYISRSGNRKGWTRRKFVFLFFCFPFFSFFFFSLPFSFISFSFLFLFFFFFLFSPVSFLVGSVDFLASVYIQVYNNVRWNGGIFRLAGARAVGESVSLESIENCERIMLVSFFFLRARIRFGDYPFFLNKEQIQSIYFFEFLKFFYGRYEMILNWSSCWLNYAISNSETVNACTFHGGSDSTLLFFFFFPTSGRCTCNEDRNPTRKRNKHSVTGKDAPSNSLKLIRPRFPVAGKGAASSNRECHLDEFHTSWSRMSQVRRTLLFGVWKYVFHPIQITFHRCHARFPLLTLGFIIAYSKLFGIGWCKNLYIIEWWLWVFCLIFCFSY